MRLTGIAASACATALLALAGTASASFQVEYGAPAHGDPGTTTLRITDLPSGGSADSLIAVSCVEGTVGVNFVPLQGAIPCGEPDLLVIDGGPGDDVIDLRLVTASTGFTFEDPDFDSRTVDDVEVDARGDGHSGLDRIFGSGFADLIGGRSDSGHDLIAAGPGNDLVFGERGDDVIRGNGGRLGASGQEGDDVIRGGRADDFIQGHEGRDRLIGLAGPDLLRGNQGADTLIGGPGADLLRPGPGLDLIAKGNRPAARRR